MFRPAGYSDSEESDGDGFDFQSDKQNKTVSSAPDQPDQGGDTAPTTDQDKLPHSWLPISGCELNSSHSVLTTSDLVLAIEAGDLASVLACLTVIEVNTPLPVWGGGQSSPALLATAQVQPAVLAALVERGGRCGGEGLLTLAGGVDQNSNKVDVMECAGLLVTMDGEKVDSVQRQGMTPLMLASRGGCEVLVSWLADQGADLDRRDSQGWSALMFSVDRGVGEVVRLLLDKGADPMIVSCDGQRAADIAASSSSCVMQDIIESFCGDRGRGVVARGEEMVKKFTEMENVLLGLDLREFVPVFREHKVGLEEFLLMREGDIERLGVDKVGAVKRLLVGQAEIHKADWAKSSLPSVAPDHRREGLMLTTPTATAMIANISQHARYIKANIGYIRLQLRQHGERLLSAGGDLVTPHQMRQQLDGCSSQLGLLCTEVNMLRRELARYPITREQGHADRVGRVSVAGWGVVVGCIVIVGCVWGRHRARG
eukprot:GFUD01002123.1.p1 GENE.GFUD01002123.1~~GFUD01002123.1.p1  ORF type:complete len:485 (+),score=192.90 GFUD01002123.1:828-2282(+)